ncbi:MAG: DUF7654 domain-containing protein, partial [Segetibacter sp.]
FYIDQILSRSAMHNLSLKSALFSQKFVALALTIALVVVGVLFVQQKSTIIAIKNTKHPGVRHFKSGGSSVSFGETRNLLIGGSLPQILERPALLNQSSYFEKTKTGNQSEAAGNIWILPMLLAFVAITYFYTRKRLPVFPLRAGCFIIVWMLVPGISLPIINQVPPNRWNLAVGLSSFIMLGFLYTGLKKYQLAKNKNISRLLLAISAVSVAISVILFLSLNADFPGLISKKDALIFSLLAILPPLLLALKYYKSALTLMSIVTLAITYNVNPLYHGVAAATKNPLERKIKAIDAQQSGSWLMAAGFAQNLEAVPLLAGVKSITSHYSYPQDFWKYFDPKGKNEEIYNRTAHIAVNITDQKTKIYLIRANLIGVDINPCDRHIINSLNITYIITHNEIAPKVSSCVQELNRVAGGQQVGQFIIYKSKLNR